MQITFKESTRKIFSFFFLPHHLQNHFSIYINYKSAHIPFTTVFKISWFFSRQSHLKLQSLAMASTNLFLLTLSFLVGPECPMSPMESTEERSFPSFCGGGLLTLMNFSRPLSTKGAKCWDIRRRTESFPRPIIHPHTGYVHKIGKPFLYVEGWCENHASRNSILHKLSPWFISIWL